MVDAISEQFVAVSAQVDFVDLAGLITHWSGSLAGAVPETHWRRRGCCKENDRSPFLPEGEGRVFLPRQEENQRGCYRDAC